MIAVILFCFLLSYNSGIAQEPRTGTSSPRSWIQFSGYASLFGEMYNSESSTASRRPPETGRLILRPTITLWEDVVLPFELYLSNENSVFRQPFNNFGIAPRITKDITLYGGYHTLPLSQFSLTDRRIFGGGADIHLGNFRIAASGGRSQSAVERDSATFQNGVYRQYLVGAKIGYDNPQGSAVSLNALTAWDDTTSLKTQPSGILPEQNLLTSLDFRVPILAALVLEAEFAASMHTRNLFSDTVVIDGMPKELPNVRSSSRIDGAGFVSLGFQSQSFSLKSKTEYIGPGFVSLGNLQLLRDKLRTDFSPTFSLFENKLRVSGSIGLEWNNLANNQTGTTQRVTGSAMLSGQLDEHFGFDAMYQNYGSRLNASNDTLRVQNVFSMLMLSPRYIFQTGNVQHFISANFSIQDYSDDNLLTKQYSENSSKNISLLWNGSFGNSMFSSSVSYLSYESAAIKNSGLDVLLSGSRKFFDGSLTPTLSLSWASYDASSGLSGKLGVGLRANYQLAKSTSIALQAGVNKYQYSGGTVPSYNEYQSNVEIRQNF